MGTQTHLELRRYRCDKQRRAFWVLAEKKENHDIKNANNFVIK
jgi:hypothetical protein